MKVAIVHDWLTTIGGAEKVLRELLKLYPEATLFSLFDVLTPSQREVIFQKRARTSFLQRLPFVKQLYPYYLSLMPYAIESLDLSGFDLIISSSWCVAKGVIVHPGQRHICYCHTPMRFAWDRQSELFPKAGFLKKILAARGLHRLRLWDTLSAARVDSFLTNSQFVARRIENAYRRSATVIGCGIDTSFFSFHEPKEDYYLTVSRLVPYKRIDLLIEAFSQLPDKKLVIIGEGPEAKKLKSKATENVTFLGYQSIETVRYYLQRAKAFVFAAKEDFGIAPLEALSTGTPVIAFGEGGAKETLDSVGHFFKEQTAQALVEAIRGLQKKPPLAYRKRAELFSLERFASEMKRAIEKEIHRDEGFDFSRRKRDETVAAITQITSQTISQVGRPRIPSL